MSTVRQVAPYAVWMGLMMALPATAWGYAARTIATLLCLLACTIGVKEGLLQWSGRSKVAIPVGLAVGVLVWVAWVFPENFALYRKWFIIGDVESSGPSPYDPAVCGWPLTMIRLFGSAFVIAAVEEIFFRGWLYNWIAQSAGDKNKAKAIDVSAFIWMVALFAIEHNRWLAGALAGAAYGLISIRFGLFSAIIAHITTNLILGLQVIFTGNWAFW